MRKLLYPLITAFALAACQDNQPSVTAPANLRPSLALSIAQADEWLVRADAVDVSAAVDQLATKAAEVAATSSSSSGGNVECTGFLTGTFDNVTVPENTLCTISNAVIRNNLLIKKNALLGAFNTRVGNNVNGENARVVQMSSSTIGNNFDVNRAGDPVFFSGLLSNVTVNGNAQLSRHDPAQIGVFSSRIGNNLDVNDNIGRTTFRLDILFNTVGHQADVSRNVGTGFAAVQLNTVTDRLRCLDNALPFIGGPNTAGQTEGQCF